MYPTRNLILTCSSGYSIAGLAPFVCSWKQNVPDTDLVVFCANTTPETVDWLLSNNAQVIPALLPVFPTATGVRRAAIHFSSVYARRVFETALRLIDRRNIARLHRTREALLDISASRYFDYLRFLELFGHRFSSVLLTDCRDVVFQAPPFRTGGLCVYAENQSIGTSHFARRWFQLTYGSREWRALSDRPFLCSGTTHGSVADVMDYLRVMTLHLENVMAMSGEDQAVHNHIVHRGHIAARICSFGEGDVITLNQVPLDTVRVENGKLLAAAGHPYPVVHQYDRVPGLAQRLIDAALPTHRAARA